MAKPNEPKGVKRTEIKARAMAAAASIAPNSYNPETREFEAVLSGGAAVVRVDWMRGELYLEELDMSPGSVRLQRFQSGQAPILDNHSRWSVRADQVGVVRTAELRDEKLVYRGKLSGRDDLSGMRQDVQEGIVRNQSAGYIVHRYIDVTKPDDRMRRLRAVDWEPTEASFAVIPAEIDQGVRGAWWANQAESREFAGTRALDAEHVCVIECREASEEKMDPETIEPTKANGAKQGGERTADTTPPPGQAPSTAVLDQERKKIAEEERARCEGIRSLAAKHQLGEEFARKQIDGGVSLQEARAAALEVIEKRQTANTVSSRSSVSTGGQDEDVTMLRGITEQLEVRANVLPPDKMTDNGKRFRGLSLVELGREILQAHGFGVRGLTKDQVFDALMRASQTRSMHGTGDFAEVTANVAGKSMRKAYDAQPQRWRSLSRPNTAPDFKSMKRVQLSQIGALQQVNEHGEIRRTTLSDTAEAYALKSYGNIIGFTRQLFINDDMGALSRIARMFGAAAAEMENQIMWALIAGNPTMGDGVALFHATHNNLVDTGSGAGVLDETGLKNMRGKLRNQKDFKGNTVQVEPRKLIVPTTLEVAALKYTAVITAAKASDVNIFGGAFDEVIVDAHLDAYSTAAWYIAGSPDQYDLLEHSTLEGSSGPTISERVGFETDGFDLRVLHDFGGAVLEFVSIAKSTGT